MLPGDPSRRSFQAMLPGDASTISCYIVEYNIGVFGVGRKVHNHCVCTLQSIDSSIFSVHAVSEVSHSQDLEYCTYSELDYVYLSVIIIQPVMYSPCLKYHTYSLSLVHIRSHPVHIRRSIQDQHNDYFSLNLLSSFVVS